MDVANEIKVEPTDDLETYGLEDATPFTNDYQTLWSSIFKYFILEMFVT